MNVQCVMAVLLHQNFMKLLIVNPVIDSSVLQQLIGVSKAHERNAMAWGKELKKYVLPDALTAINENQSKNPKHVKIKLA